MQPVGKKDCDNHTKIMTEKIDKLKENLNGFELKLTKQIAELPGKLENKFDDKYASKRIEKGFDKMIWIVIAGVLVGLLNLILR